MSGLNVFIDILTFYMTELDNTRLDVFHQTIQISRYGSPVAILFKIIWVEKILFAITTYFKTILIFSRSLYSYEFQKSRFIPSFRHGFFQCLKIKVLHAIIRIRHFLTSPWKVKLKRNTGNNNDLQLKSSFFLQICSI